MLLAALALLMLLCACAVVRRVRPLSRSGGRTLTPLRLPLVLRWYWPEVVTRPG